MRLEPNYYDDILCKCLKLAVWRVTATGWHFAMINKLFLAMVVHAYVEWADQSRLQHMVGFVE